MTHMRIDVHERDGYKRGGVAYSIRLTFAESACSGENSTRVIHPDGSELPIQMDVIETWPDGSIRSADVLFPLRLPPNGSGTYTLETGPGVTPQADQRNPVTIVNDETELTVNQGPVTYRVRTDAFNGVDTAVFNRDVWQGKHPTGAEISGPKSFSNPGSPAPMLRTHDDRLIEFTGPVDVRIETCGPRTGQVRLTGSYSESLGFKSVLTFYSGVSWYRHAFSLTGKTDEIASVTFEETFDLADGPLLSAYGARINSWDVPTSWAVLTDGVSTIDVAVSNAWSDAGYVRYETHTDGRFQIIAPYTGDEIVSFYHFLITPPADDYHTPAGAMVADPHLAMVAD